MPDFSDEPHLGGFEGVFGGDFDVDGVGAGFVGGVGGAGEVAFEVGEVGDVGGAGGGGDGDAGVGVFVDVLDFFLEAAGAVGGHVGGMWGGLSRGW